MSVYIVESAARDCFFGPPPKPEAGNPDPRHWMKQAMEEVRKNCPGRRQTEPAEQPTTPKTNPSGKQNIISYLKYSILSKTD